MYSDAELDAAVAAGVLSARAAEGFRAFAARRRQGGDPDEERFRLLTGFNDIFVSAGAGIVLLAVGVLAHQFAGPESGAAATGAAVAVAAWGLAEYFTRRRRMALPSVLLLMAFAGGIAAALLWLSELAIALGGVGQEHGVAAAAGGGVAKAVRIGIRSLAAVAAVGAIYLHWRRFAVPITVAAGAILAAGAAWLLLCTAFEELAPHQTTAIFVAGLGMFALAMRWDMRDPARLTRRADVAFWLHLSAAPAIVHPAFGALGLGFGSTDLSVGSASLAIAIYLALALVALAVDRRALLVSALGYVIFAISALLRHAGSLDTAFALACLVIGGALLLLSAGWHAARRQVLRLLPTPLLALLPPG